MLPTVYLAAEDEAGLAVGRKLIAEAPPLTVYREENANGYGQLKRKVGNFNQMGRNGLPVLMLTDLDNRTCPSGMIAEWLKAPLNPGFLFRICVREIDAWLMADRERFAEFLGIGVSRIALKPEALSDPKAELIRLSQTAAKREMRTGFKPLRSATIGPRHNEYLKEFVSGFWRPSVADKIAPSLGRARYRIREIATQVIV